MTKYWFLSTQYRYRAKFTLAVIALTFCVIMLGAYTRLTDAGLSCPDWPHCYGYLTAPHTEADVLAANAKFPSAPVETKKAWTEMIHRYFAGTLGLLMLVISGSLLFTRRAKDAKTYLIAVGLLCLLGVQIMLGMLTVTEKLKPIIVTSHLLTGISLLLLLWWAYADLQLRDDFFVKRTPHRLTPWLALGFIIVLSQIALGGWVSTHYAGLACVDLPFCNNMLLPLLHLDQLNSDLVTIHMLHRLGAVVTALYVGALSFYLISQRTFRAIGTLMLSLLLLQLTLGILNILWLRPISLAMLHHGVAILLLLTVMTALIKACIQLREKHYAS